MDKTGKFVTIDVILKGPVNWLSSKIVWSVIAIPGLGQLSGRRILDLLDDEGRKTALIGTIRVKIRGAPDR